MSRIIRFFENIREVNLPGTKNTGRDFVLVYPLSSSVHTTINRKETNRRLLQFWVNLPFGNIRFVFRRVEILERYDIVLLNKFADQSAMRDSAEPNLSAFSDSFVSSGARS